MKDYLQEKRKEFLRKLEEHLKKYKKMEELFGPGMTRKLLRLIQYPSIYVPYIFWKLGVIKEKKRKLF